MMALSLRSLAVVSAGLLITTGARAADTFKADPVHSSVVFRVKHMNTSYSWGRFNDIAGSFTLDPVSPGQSKLQFTIKAASVDTGNAMRDTHLKNPDFFNATQYPTITFVSKSVVKSDTAYDVTGDLTFHGVTKPISFRLTPVGTGKDMKGKPIAGIEANFTLRQSDFGITKMAAAIGDDVWVNVSVEGIAQ
jgi:polyisoprenoid-binding protein YceI